MSDVEGEKNYVIVEKEHKAQLDRMKLEVERGKEKLEIAMRMKKNGYSVGEIAAMTGLKKTEINKLK